ncbi:MAG TPA: VWA domain-containing protein [Spirochaetia bacterium]|nr:VWA domain-containing protein [Spirochaetia bacterium]
MSAQSPLWLLAVALVPPLVLLTLRGLRRRPESLSAGRTIAFLGLRSAAIISLALGLAGLSGALRSDRLFTVFLLDQSRSVAAAERERAVRMVEATRSRLRGSDTAALVRFGADAQTDALEPGVPVSEEGVDVDTEATNIGLAIQDGLAQDGRGAVPRIVLLSDGNETRGSAEAAAGVARAMGARIFPVPLGVPEGGTEVAVDDVQAPMTVRQAEASEVTVMVRSRTDVTARVTLFQDAAPVATRVMQLSAGDNAVQFTTVFPQRGLHALDAVVEAPGDVVAQNNHNRRLIEAGGPPQVLYVSRPGRSSPSLLSALSAQGIPVVERTAAELPGTLAGCLPYDAIILDNVPGYGISTEKMELIAQYVRDAGGGLLMAGGSASFGVGGYYKTPIERVLPVDMDAKSQVQLPGLSLVIVMDKSGSTGETVPSGETKLDVVKSAALSAVEALNPFDRVGVIAFDADWLWAVPMTNAGDIRAIAANLATVSSGGGTIMYPALEEADRVLSTSRSPLRHVILLTDGLTDAGDFKGLVARMGQHHITVSTVAVGEDADTDLLASIARWGRGRSYATSDPRDVPRIFLADTMLATTSLVVEKSFFPREVSSAEMIRGLSLGSIPPLEGFVLTYMKPGAEQALSALYDAPLLASWRFGLGRTAAFTSDFGGRWSAEWLGWNQFPRFAAQLVRWIERPSGPPVLHPRIETAAGRASVTVDAYDSLGRFVDGLEMSGILLRPGGARTELRVPQTGPGLYQVTFPAEDLGDYTLTLAARSGATELAPLTVGTSLAYSEEYRMQGPNTVLLNRLANATGGRVVSSAEDAAGMAALLRREPGPSGSGSDAWRLLLLAAALLFCADIAVRRLASPRALFDGILARLRALRGSPALSSSELGDLVRRTREEERARIKARLSGAAQGGKLDSDLAAYLYIARLHSSRVSREERAKDDGNARDTAPRKKG